MLEKRVSAPNSKDSKPRELHEELGPAVLPFIDGQPRGGTGETLACVNPASGDPFARVACASPVEINEAVESAVTAAALWRGSPFEERSYRLNRLAKVIRDQSEEIAGLIALEQGKPVVEALSLEILPALDHLEFLAKHAERFSAGEDIEPRHPLYSHKRSHYLHDPLGVVAVVTPFNLPFAIPLVRVASALAMGNAVVLKPSEFAPLSGLRVGEVCAEAGLPSGLVNVLPASREETLRLVAHPKVDKVFVTGTLETGQHVMATAGCAPRPVVLSLGGNHPSVVAADADVDRAARGVVWGALANAGQNCGAVERVFVVERAATRFVERVLQEVDRVRTGDPLTSSVEMGPMISEARREDVHRQVEEAVSGGGRLLRGGTVPEGPGFFYPPTVVLNPPTNCRLLRDETLGPVIPIIVVENLERALLLSNDSPYALTASGWTASTEIAERLMVGLHAGVVTVNDVLYAFGEPAATWSGYRRSGLGYTHGFAGLREMARQRFVSYDPLPSQGPLFGFPYDAEASGAVRALLGSLHGRRTLRRLADVFRVFRLRRIRSRIPTRSLIPLFRRSGRSGR